MRYVLDLQHTILQSELPSPARLILLTLTVKADWDTGVISDEHTPALATLTAMTGLAKSTVVEWLDALEGAGWIKRDRPERFGRRTRYALLFGANNIAGPARLSRRTPQGVPTGPHRSAQHEHHRRAGTVDGAGGARLQDSPSHGQTHTRHLGASPDLDAPAQGNKPIEPNKPPMLRAVPAAPAAGDGAPTVPEPGDRHDVTPRRTGSPPATVRQTDPHRDCPPGGQSMVRQADTNGPLTGQSMVRQADTNGPLTGQSMVRQADHDGPPGGHATFLNSPSESSPSKDVQRVSDVPARERRREAPSTEHGTRIRSDFTVTTDMQNWARQNTPDVARSATAAFVDYWRAQPDPGGRKNDWVASWRNWLRREQADIERRPGYHGPARQTAPIATAALSKSDQCPRHRGNRAVTCGLCRSERIAVDGVRPEESPSNGQTRARYERSTPGRYAPARFVKLDGPDESDERHVPGAGPESIDADCVTADPAIGHQLDAVPLQAGPLTGQSMVRLADNDGPPGGHATFLNSPSESSPSKDVQRVGDVPARERRREVPSTEHGTRIPSDFTVTTDMQNWARQNTPDVARSATAAFVDYWRAQPDPGGRKNDWVASWRNWLRREQADIERRPGYHGPARQTAPIATAALSKSVTRAATMSQSPSRTG